MSWPQLGQARSIESIPTTSTRVGIPELLGRHELQARSAAIIERAEVEDCQLAARRPSALDADLASTG
jgi:hypothetical protein